MSGLTTHKRVNITVTPDNHILLKRHSYGNVSRLIELMVQAYDQGRALTEEEVIEGKLRDDTNTGQKVA